MPQFTLIVKREMSKIESKLSFRTGESLLLLCQKAGIAFSSPCGGKGICGKCKVRFLSGAPLPTPSERRHIPVNELRQGYRLACMAIPTSDCEIVLPMQQSMDIIGTEIPVSWDAADSIDSKNQKEKYIVTADIGTTTIVMEKRRIRDGRTVSVYRAVNAQKKYGADVLSRIEASVAGHRKELSELVREQLINGLHKLNNGQAALNLASEPVTKKSPNEDIAYMVIAANTSMIHLLMGYDVSALGRAPFIPKTLDEIETEIGGVRTYIMPGISAFVGADLTAGMYAVSYLKKQIRKPLSNGENYVNLLVDLGTNAEMILFDDKRAVCTSTAAGCAFDSIADAGIYGADVIAILAELLKNGAIDEHGTLRDELFESGAAVKINTWCPPNGDKQEEAVACENPGKIHEVNITQNQIRQMQLAKAAVRCGIDCLTEVFGCRLEDISQVYLAGGFGLYLNVDAAVTVGLLPKQCRDLTLSCGNTALAGAAVYAMEKLIASDKKGISAYQRNYTALNLAKQPDFSQRYISYLDFAEHK